MAALVILAGICVIFFWNALNRVPTPKADALAGIGLILAAAATLIAATLRRRLNDVLNRDPSTAEAFRIVIHHNPAPMLVYERESMGILYANPAALDTFGYRLPEMQAMTVLDLYTPDLRPTVAQLVRTPSDGFRKVGLRTLTGRGGRQMTADLVTYDITFEGKSCRLVSLYDVSGLLQAQHELAHTSGRLQTLIDSSPLAIVAVEAGGRIGLWSRAAAEMLGWQGEEALHKNVSEILPDLLPDSAWADAEAGQPLRGQPVRVRRADGQVIDASLFVSPIREDGRPAGCVAVLEDTTPLHQSEQRYRELFENANDGILILDRDTIVDCNQRAADLLSYPAPASLIGRSVVDLSPLVQPGGAASVEAARQYILQNVVGSPVFEWRHLSAKGLPVEIEVSLNPFHTPQGQFTLCMWREISERKQAEEALRGSEEKFSRAFQANPAAVAIIGMQDDITLDINKSYERVMGVQRADVIGKPARETGGYLSEPVRELVMDQLRKIGYVRDLPVDFRSQNGEARQGRFSAEVIWIGGKPYALTVIEDLTEQKQTEARAAAAADELSAVVSALPDIILRVDAQGSVLSTHAPPGSELAENVAALVGQPVSRLLPGTTAPLKFSLQQALARREVQSFELETRLGDRTCQWEVRVSPAGKDEAVLVYRDISDRKEAEERNRRQIERISSLRTIDLAISSRQGLRAAVKLVLAQATNQLGVDAAEVLLLSPALHELSYLEGSGFRTPEMHGSSLPLGEGFAGKAAYERRTVIIPDLAAAERNSSSDWYDFEGFTSLYAIPLTANGQVRGVLQAFLRRPFQPDQEWLDYIETLAGQAAVAIESSMLLTGLQQANDDLSQAYESTLEGWSRALDLRDRETEGHTQRVTELTLALCRRMNISGEDMVQIRRGALLHDIGKMGIPDQILNKPGPLNEHEWEVMRCHPRYAYELLSPIEYLRPAIDIPFCHHELWDGSGYPRGLKGEEIPLAARIFAVADVWDALTSQRPYRPPWTPGEALHYLQAHAGTHFDPAVVEHFAQHMAETIGLRMPTRPLRMPGM